MNLMYCKSVRCIRRTKCSGFIDNVLANNFKIYYVMETCPNDTALSYDLFPDLYCVFHVDRDYLTSNKKKKTRRWSPNCSFQVII
jgi:hypothetical protein